MSYHLINKLGKPFEREYEGWLSLEIENYFKSFGVDSEVIVISPNDENLFPTDTFFFSRGKVIGLQLKRLYSNKDVKNLKWTFSKRQHDLMIQHDFPIYYALPAFYNRKLKRVALHHYLFYKAEKSFSKDTKTVNYVDDKFSESITIDKSKYSVCRWGKFVEMIFNCTVGKKITTADIATSRDIKINQILDEPNGLDILKELLSTTDVFNLGSTIKVDTTEHLYSFFNQYLDVLKETNKQKIDLNENEEVLLLISIKS